MAGIYIHIPYCKTRCAYCDFYTQTDQSVMKHYLDTLCREVKLRKDYLANEAVETIYFGGGTPSQLSVDQVKKILDVIKNCFCVAEDAEITFEANPDDLNEEYLSSLRSASINRLSIGVQSFDDEELAFLKRRHSAQQVADVVRDAQLAGFGNISIDLMYGLPNQTLDAWKSNIVAAVGLGIQHISAYHLIYEEGTRLMDLLQKGKIETTKEELSVEMFSVLIDTLCEAKFEHYEISNFAKNGMLSRHNTSYWKGVKYLGLGAAAHSYNGVERSWNVSSLAKYIEGIERGKPDLEVELLDLHTSYNEYILTRMRTKWGVDVGEIVVRFGTDLANHFRTDINRHIKYGFVSCENDVIRFTRKGIFISDGIMSELMLLN